MYSFVPQAIAADEAPPPSDAPSAAPAGDVTADTLPAIDTGTAEGDAAAAPTTDDIAERADAAALPTADERVGATSTATDGVPAIDGIATANGAAAAAANDGDRESGELDATGPTNAAEAGGTSAAPRDARRHVSKDGKERYACLLTAAAGRWDSAWRRTRHD